MEYLVLDQLSRLDIPLTIDQLTEAALKSKKTPKSRTKAVRLSILTTTLKLRNSKHLDTFTNRQGIKFMALSEWFDKDGQIQFVFSKKVNA